MKRMIQTYYFMISAVILVSNSGSARTGRVKNILFWNSFFEHPNWRLDSWLPIFKSECPVNNCEFTSDRNYLGSTGDFEALLFHSFNLPWFTNDLPDPGSRVDRQRYVFFSHESPLMDGQNLGAYNGYFNWTMSYRLDSDIYLPYGHMYPKQDNRIESDPGSMYPPVYPSAGSSRLEDSKEKLTKSSSKGLVSWVVSKCDSPSDRSGYVNKLQEYINVDIYGKCNGVPCDKDCYLNVLKSSKFYLALENSNCEDYITEKFWNALAHHVVPVVQSDGSHTKVAPPGSYVDTKDFGSPESLASYLRLLNENSTLYNQYLWWTKHYTVHNNITHIFAKAMCELCTKLDSGVHKVYKNMDEWWEYNKCTVPVHNNDWFHPRTRIFSRPRELQFVVSLCSVAILVILYNFVTCFRRCTQRRAPKKCD